MFIRWVLVGGVSALEDFGFWLPKWRFFGCRLSAFLVADSETGAFKRSYCLYFRGLRFLVAEMALFWLPTQRFLSCRLKVAESALLVVDSDSFWLPTQPFFGCRLIVADSDLLVADSDRNRITSTIFAGEATIFPSPVVPIAMESWTTRIHGKMLSFCWAGSMSDGWRRSSRGWDRVA